METRKFEIKEAVRERVPLMIGLVGPSGSGKTFSALRLATGMQRVSGGDIGLIDTEARRSLHYADKFKFLHMPFGAPFSPLDYLAAIEAMVKRGVKTIIVDSMSHEHEGPGGVLEWHAVATEEAAKRWNKDPEKVQLGAWAEPKAARRRLINSILQLDINGVFCFRAKDKIKVIPGRPPESLGWMPIAGEEFIFEMTANILLYPGSNGVPTLAPKEFGEKGMIKTPGQFESILTGKAPLSEETGEAMARWADGAPAKPRMTIDAAFDATCDVAGGAEVVLNKLCLNTRDQLTEEHREKLAALYKASKVKV